MKCSYFVEVTFHTVLKEGCKPLFCEVSDCGPRGDAMSLNNVAENKGTGCKKMRPLMML